MTVASNGSPRVSSGINSKAFSYMPSVENNSKFKHDCPRTGRTAAELNRLFKLPNRGAYEPSRWGHFSRVGDRPTARDKDVDAYVRQLEAKELKAQKKLAYQQCREWIDDEDDLELSPRSKAGRRSRHTQQSKS